MGPVDCYIKQSRSRTRFPEMNDLCVSQGDNLQSRRVGTGVPVEREGLRFRARSRDWAVVHILPLPRF